MSSDRYPFHEIEAKWQGIWESSKQFRVSEDAARPKFYCLEMFPYPSGRIHMGHVRVYAIGDLLARYKWMRGFNVLHPMGWDAFGLPAENAAMERKVHPKAWTYDNIAAMKKQLQTMGLSLDWSRIRATCDPSYYKHQQKMFLDFMKAGLDLLVREHGLTGRAPVDGRAPPVREAALEHADEDQLLPLVVLRLARGDLAAPGVADAQPLQLPFHVRDVVER